MRNAAAVGIQPTQQQQQQQHHIMPPGHQTPVPLGGIQIHPGLQYGNHIGGGGQRGSVVSGLGPGGDQIRDVWAANLDQEMAQVRNLITQYPYVSMDTEFPGVVARPIGQFKTSNEYHYQTLRCNVDLLKMIQVGLTLCDENGNTPPGGGTWQFNFKFDLKYPPVLHQWLMVSSDTYAQDSIDMLSNSAGIDFSRSLDNGIDQNEFGELLITSGLVLLEDVTWITFTGGYDLGYLLKTMTSVPLPPVDTEFFDLLTTYFPSVYDARICSERFVHSQRKGLQDIADELNIKRQGNAHQAGSDALLTSRVFFEIKKNHAGGLQSDLRGTIHGLNDYSNRVSPSDQSPYIPDLQPNRNNTPGPIGGTTSSSLNSVNASAPAFTPRGTTGAKEVFQFGKMGGI